MTPADAQRSPAWERALREHLRAVADVVRTIEHADRGAWRRAPAPDKWSPAQVAEHLVLTYEAMLRDLAGTDSLRPRVGPGLSRLLRWVLLPHILFHQSFPLRAAAPRELRPSESGLDPDAALSRIPDLASRFHAEIQEPRAARRVITHPYFGPIPPLKALRFCSAHLQHHRRQLLDALAA